MKSRTAALLRGLRSVLGLTIAVGLLSGCAYRLGSGSGRIAGGYRQVSIPIFKNRSQETGIEVTFTQALYQQFLRSQSTQIVEDPMAEVRVEGEIVSVTYFPDAKRTSDDSSTGYLPMGTVIASQYRILAVVDARVVRRSDSQVLWQGRFTGERTYSAPQVTLSGVNTVNPLYNLSARRQNIAVIAEDMMLEAYGRMTENF